MADTTIETALWAILIGDATVAGLVGTRVYPNLVPQGADMPAVTYEQITGPREHVMTQTLGIAKSIFQINCWSSSYSETKALAEAVRNELSDFTGTVNTREIKQATIENEGDMPRVSTDIESMRRYGKHLDLEICYAEATS